MVPGRRHIFCGRCSVRRRFGGIMHAPSQPPSITRSTHEPQRTRRRARRAHSRPTSAAPTPTCRRSSTPSPTPSSSGEVVAISGFAKFARVDRAARMGRNPQTGEAIRIKASRRVRVTPAEGVQGRGAHRQASGQEGPAKKARRPRRPRPPRRPCEEGAGQEGRARQEGSGEEDGRPQGAAPRRRGEEDHPPLDALGGGRHGSSPEPIGKTGGVRRRGLLLLLARRRPGRRQPALGSGADSGDTTRPHRHRARPRRRSPTSPHPARCRGCATSSAATTTPAAATSPPLTASPSCSPLAPRAGGSRVTRAPATHRAPPLHDPAHPAAAPAARHRPLLTSASVPPARSAGKGSHDANHHGAAACAPSDRSPHLGHRVLVVVGALLCAAMAYALRDPDVVPRVTVDNPSDARRQRRACTRHDIRRPPHPRHRAPRPAGRPTSTCSTRATTGSSRSRPAASTAAPSGCRARSWPPMAGVSRSPTSVIRAAAVGHVRSRLRR